MKLCTCYYIYYILYLCGNFVYAYFALFFSFYFSIEKQKKNYTKNRVSLFYMCVYNFRIQNINQQKLYKIFKHALCTYHDDQNFEQFTMTYKYKKKIYQDCDDIDDLDTETYNVGPLNEVEENEHSMLLGQSSSARHHGNVDLLLIILIRKCYNHSLKNIILLLLLFFNKI